MILNRTQIHYEFSTLHPKFYSDFEPWRKKRFIENLPKGGVYILIADKPIGRVLGEDPEGILYIGQGKILHRDHRLGKLINSLNQTEQMHEAGMRYNKANFAKKFPLQTITLRVILTNSPRNKESELLGKYYQTYGELPPLNRQG